MRKPYEGIIFVSKPRCASTAVFEHLYDWDDKAQGSKPMYHMSSSDMKQRMGTQNWSLIPSFGIIREPESLIVSWYQHHKFGRPSLAVGSRYPDDINQWVEQGFNTHWDLWTDQGSLSNPLKQKQWLYTGDEKNVSFILRLEDLDWSDIEKYGISMSQLQIRNSSPKRTEAVLTSSSVEIIKRVFLEDYQCFNY